MEPLVFMALKIFELLGFGVRKAQFLTLGNYISYFFIMTLTWLSIDDLGRWKLMVWGAAGLTIALPSSQPLEAWPKLTTFPMLQSKYPEAPSYTFRQPSFELAG
jgi:hypothetical protein